MEQGSKFSSSYWSMFASNNAMDQSNSRISDPKFQHKSVFENLTCHLPTKVRRVDFAMPNQKGTTADRSKSSKNLKESPKKISSTSSADKQSSATSNKRPLSTQKLEAPGDTLARKSRWLKKPPLDMSKTYPIPEETGEILWITAPFYSKQRQRTWRHSSIAPIKDLYFFKVKKDTLLLSSLTSPTLKRKIKLST